MKLLKPISFLVLTGYLFACNEAAKKTTDKPVDTKLEEKNISAMLDSFNKAATRADFNTYFGYYTDDAVFTGTDATERWNKKEFMEWAKPIFARGRAWDFTAINRHIYFDQTGNMAWFDELLNTQMKICRGSGVLIKQDSTWKLKQYILTATIPNDKLDSVIPMKAHQEDSIINKLSGK